MKNIRTLQLLLLLTIFSTTLTGCAAKNDKILIPKVSFKVTDENYYTSFSKDLMESYITGERSFIAYFSNPNCTACNLLKPLLINYVKYTSIELNLISTASDDYKANSDYYTDTIDLKATPSLLIFDQGELVVKEVGRSNLQTKGEVSKFFKQYIRTTNLYIKEEQTELKGRKHALISYDFKNSEQQKIVNNYLINQVAGKEYVYLNDATEFSLLLKGEPLIELSVDLDIVEQAKTSFINYFNK